MEIINTKRYKDFVQDLREILNQTQMISYEIKNREIKNKLSDIELPRSKLPLYSKTTKGSEKVNLEKEIIIIIKKKNI